MRSGDYLYVRYPNEALDWWDAESKCSEKGVGGHLAYFPDAATQNAVYSGLSLSGYNWIGLRNEGGYDFRWIGGAVPTFTTWQWSEPNDGIESLSCAALAWSIWLDADCSNEFVVLCSYPIL